MDVREPHIDSTHVFSSFQIDNESSLPPIALVVEIDHLFLEVAACESSGVLENKLLNP